MTLPPSFQVTLCVLLAAGGCYIQALLVLPVAIYSGHKIVKHCGLEALTSNILERAEVFGNAPRAERTCAACDFAVPRVCASGCHLFRRARVSLPASVFCAAECATIRVHRGCATV